MGRLTERGKEKNFHWLIHILVVVMASQKWAKLKLRARGSSRSPKSWQRPKYLGHILLIFLGYLVNNLFVIF